MDFVKRGARLAGWSLFVALVLTPFVRCSAQQILTAQSAYRSELAQYRFYASAKWQQLVPGEATMADVRRVLGDPDEANDIVQYTKPYPGDSVAKQPVFTYTRIMPGWDVLIYFNRYCFRKHAHDPNGDRLCSIDLIPKRRISFSGVQFPSDFKKEQVVAADAAWDEYTAADGLRYEVYTTRTPYGGKLPGDLNRISYGAPYPIVGEAVDQGDIGYPLKGFIGYTNTGTPVSEMTVECFTSSGENVGTTMTDAAGMFSFPTLPEGRYDLKATKAGWYTLTTTVNSTRKSSNVLSLVAEAE